LHQVPALLLLAASACRMTPALYSSPDTVGSYR
jgi:hypothetical protein